MLFNTTEIQTASCSKEERVAAARLADTMAEMAETAAKEGLFALSRYDTEKSGFLGEGINIVLEGSDSSGKAIRESALAGGKRGQALLERLMMAQGLAGIAAGEGAALVQLKVKAYAGIEFFLGERRQKAIQAYMSLGFDRAAAEQMAEID